MTFEEIQNRKTLLREKMVKPYDRDFAFIIKRLYNKYNTPQGQIHIYINDTVLFEEGKATFFVTMNKNPKIDTVKHIENPSLTMIGKILGTRLNPGWYLGQPNFLGTEVFMEGEDKMDPNNLGGEDSMKKTKEDLSKEVSLFKENQRREKLMERIVQVNISQGDMF